MDSEEQPFLAALEKDPNDDAARLVYADHLQERGDPRGEYLRLEVALHTARQRIEELVPLFDKQWLNSVARTWAVMVVSFPKDRIIETIRVVREVTNCGLKDAKGVVDRITATGEPQLAIDGLSEAKVEQALETLRSVGVVAHCVPSRRAR